MGVLLILFLIWGIPIWICVHLGNQKNRETAGWVCGIILGWIGVVVMAVLDPLPGK